MGRRELRGSEYSSLLSRRPKERTLFMEDERTRRTLPNLLQLNVDWSSKRAEWRSLIPRRNKEGLGSVFSRQSRGSSFPNSGSKNRIHLGKRASLFPYGIKEPSRKARRARKSSIKNGGSRSSSRVVSQEPNEVMGSRGLPFSCTGRWRVSGVDCCCCILPT